MKLIIVDILETILIFPCDKLYKYPGTVILESIHFTMRYNKCRHISFYLSGQGSIQPQPVLNYLAKQVNICSRIRTDSHWTVFRLWQQHNLPRVCAGQWVQHCGH